MATVPALFDKPIQLPAELLQNPALQRLAKAASSGVTGNQINRLSLKGGKFRFVKDGDEVAVSRSPSLDVIVVGANSDVGRTYFDKPYDPNAAPEKPTCYSLDGKMPAADAEHKQSTHCAMCPQNAKGSASNGEGRACAFKKRVVIVAPSKIEGDAFALDVSGMSLFGEDEAPQKLFNYQNFVRVLARNGLFPSAVVTRLTFDDEASVPKLFFTPMRVVSNEELAAVVDRSTSPDVLAMLADVQNTGEATPDASAQPSGSAAGARSAAPATPAPAPAQTPPSAPKQAAAAPVPEPAKPGRRTRKAPDPAPAPTGGNGQAGVAGFGGDVEMAPSGGQAAPAPVAAAAKGGAVEGFALDLEDFDG